MNKFLRIMLCAILLCTAFAQTAQAKKYRVRQQKTYMMGTAISFTDSVIYITDMQVVDSVTIQRKTHFLMDRQAYSLQLQRYLEAQKKGSHFTTAVCFGQKKKNMERRYLAIYKRYSKRNDLHISLVDQSQFRFHAEEYTEPETVETEQKALKTKKKKKK
ncbi:MAG: hypothetical protein IJ615_00205 [Bacteroidaceae bacterium]|nr:hypothetical protein [Bacteroidaceae bacterium]